MHKKKTVISILLFLIVLVTVYGWRYYYFRINKLYPKSETMRINIGDGFVYDSIYLQGISCEFYSFDEFKNLMGNGFNYPEYESNYDTNDLLFIFCTISATNVGSEEKAIPLYNATISSKTYSNGIDLTAFQIMNGDNSKLAPYLRAGETADIILPYMLFKSVLYSNTSTPELELVFQLYPQRISILIQMA